jgi:hypothetical protein
MLENWNTSLNLLREVLQRGGKYFSLVMDIKSTPIVKLKLCHSSNCLLSSPGRREAACSTDCGQNGTISVPSFIAHGRQIKWGSEKKVQWWVVGK